MIARSFYVSMWHRGSRVVDEVLDLALEREEDFLQALHYASGALYVSRSNRGLIGETVTACWTSCGPDAGIFINAAGNQMGTWRATTTTGQETTSC